MAEGYALQGNPFGPGAMDFDMIAGKLEGLRYRGDSTSLPGLALGIAGEWPARRGFNDIWARLGQAFDRGVAEAHDVAQTLEMTGGNYRRAESAAGRHVLDVVATAQQAKASLPIPPEKQDDLEYGHLESMWESFGKVWERPYFQGFAGGIVGLGLRGQAAVGKMLYEDERNDRLRLINDREIDARLARAENRPMYADDHSREAERARTRLSEWSKATERRLALGRKMSWTVVAGALAWTAVVVESGEPLDRAVYELREIAYQLGEAFGHDTDAVRRAVTAFWEGEASGAADARMVTYIDEGNRLTIEVGKLARAIAESVRALEVIHWSALGFSVAVCLAIAALRVAARFNITLDWVTKFMGWRWSTLIIVLANLVPAVAAFGVAWYKSSTIGDPGNIWSAVESHPR
ncbi:hypothetical protein [Nonomuraea sp. NPDC049400]|uniref:hypothetical protein n=1 Tax=Nonomuraea sp. NPDC049400 TaxID=3364352 RepID=UPI00378862A4